MALELTKEQRSKVAKLIKDHIAQHGNCRVGWALRGGAGAEFENSIHIREKIANTVIQSGKYSKEDSAQVRGDWNIFINPQYKIVRFNIATVIINIIIAITAIVLSILTRGCGNGNP